MTGTDGVTVVVIGYNDAAHLADAVNSAFEQGECVREVIAVDDCSTDDSPRLLDRLAAREPRLRVVRRTANSGGCGTPRNEGLERATSPYVLFLDSDDVLPPGAVRALLRAARAHDADVAGGLCVRRELPGGRELPWQRRLYERERTLDEPSALPRIAADTLCVNKLYRTDFLRAHAIRFPPGRYLYEDFVFTARVLAARPRMALVPDRVYVWHVRREGQRRSLSLDRDGVENWRARVRAHRQAVAELSGQPRLVRAARAGFLDRGLRMYVRELPRHDPSYQRAWWDLTRAYLTAFSPADVAAAVAPARTAAAVVRSAPAPRDLGRLRDLVSKPSRLLPPYARDAAGAPVWAADLPGVSLARLEHTPMDRLPLAVDAILKPSARGSRLRLRLHELYGRVAEASPVAVQAALVHRDTGRIVQRRSASLAPGPTSGTWTASLRLHLTELEAGTWDVWLMLAFADGTTRTTRPRALPSSGRLRRSAIPSRRHGLVLVHPYATHSAALALRVAPGARGMGDVVRRKVGRWVGAG
ncbi:glycosyltransferase family 2 protein [Streptomyces sp. GZWMJZ-114]|uniref:glycosyltransferase family 2 protein n=1 Tax=Streptomyces sp. GZWMJZ-114 TaxID=2494734 RepID=UPI0010103911|nr:glycosyltransferase family 2 protein [Streptomyces sp. GZWMJZ-114]